MMTVPASAATAGPAAPDREQLLLDAEQRFDRGEFRDSARTYAQFFRGLPVKEQASALGENAVFKAAEAYGRAYSATRDAIDLQESEALLQEYLDVLERQTGARDGPLAEYVAVELERVTKAIAALPPTAEPDAPADDEPADDEPADDEPADDEPADDTSLGDATPDDPLPDEPDSTPGDSTTDEPRRRVDPLGLGLTVGGIAVTGTGLGLLIHGATLVSRAEGLLEDRGGNEPGDAAYLQSAEDLRTPLVVAGGVLAAGGVAMVVVGAVRLARHRRGGPAREARLRWQPTTTGILVRW